MSRGDRCPLCRWSVRAGELCASCGVSAAAVLPVGARRGHDLEALARGAASDGSEDSAALPLVREHDACSDAELRTELAAARHRVEQEHRRLLNEGYLWGALGDCVTRLVWGEIERVVVVELDDHDVQAREIGLGTDGAPRVDAARATSNAFLGLTGTSPSPTAERYRRAGGGTVDGPDPSEAAATDLVDRVVTEAGLRERRAETDLVVIRRVVGWRAVDRVVELLRERVLPRADVVRGARHRAVDDAMADLCATAPSRWSYHLALTAVAEDGSVSCRALELFAAGTRPHTRHATTVVQLQRPAGTSGPLYLPIVRAGDGPVESWPLISLWTHPFDEVDGAVAELDARLTGPQGPELETRSAAHEPIRVAERPAGEDPRSRLPAFHRPLRPVDLLVAVEIGGVPEIVAERLELAGRVAAALARRATHAPGRVRLAAIGYSDHLAAKGRWREELRHEPFGDPHEVEAVLRRWQPVVARHDFGSALDDALRSAAGATWTAASACGLLVVGSRPPAVFPQGDERAVVCGHETQWEWELGRLHRLGVRTAAVVDRPAFMNGDDPSAPTTLTEDVWRQLSPAGEFVLGGCEVTDLLAHVAPGPEEAPTNPLVLAVAAPPRGTHGGPHGTRVAHRPVTTGWTRYEGTWT